MERDWTHMIEGCDGTCAVRKFPPRLSKIVAVLHQCSCNFPTIFSTIAAIFINKYVWEVLRKNLQLFGAIMRSFLGEKHENNGLKSKNTVFTITKLNEVKVVQHAA